MARLPYVKAYKDRHGKVRHYYRRAGFPAVALPGIVGSPEFLAAYQAAADKGRAPVGAKRTAAGSIDALCVDYYGSSDFAGLSETTRANRRAILERFRQEHGAKQVATLGPVGVRKLLDAKRETPQAANNFLKTLSALMRFAVERGWRADNPTQGVKKLRSRSDGFHTWTEAEIAQFRARWALGTKQRLALELLLGTAVRRSDVVELGPQHVSAGKISVRPQKTQGTTNKRLKIPLHRDLAAAIAATPTGHLAFLTTAHGRQFTAAGFGNWFRDQVDAAGLPARCAAHGLRKAAASRLADAGATAHMIQAVTGHATLAEVQRYTLAADQERLAEEAIRTVEERGVSNRGERLDNSGGK